MQRQDWGGNINTNKGVDNMSIKNVTLVVLDDLDLPIVDH